MIKFLARLMVFALTLAAGPALAQSGTMADDAVDASTNVADEAGNSAASAVDPAADAAAGATVGAADAEQSASDQASSVANTAGKLANDTAAAATDVANGIFRAAETFVQTGDLPLITEQVVGIMSGLVVGAAIADVAAAGGFVTLGLAAGGAVLGNAIAIRAFPEQ